MAAHGSSEVRAGAARVLARAPRNPRRGAVLVALLEDAQAAVRRTAVLSLGEGADDDALRGRLRARLLAMVRSPHYEDRYTMGSFCAGRARDPDFRDAFLRLLRDENRDVAVHALQYATQIEKDAVIPPLLQAADHDEPVVRVRAIRALYRLGDKSQLGVLAALCRHDSPDVLRAVMSAVRDAGMVELRPALIEYFTREPLPEGQYAFDAVRRIGDPSCAEVLVKIAQSDADCRCQAIDALGEIADPSVLPALEELAAAPDARVAEAARTAIDRLQQRTP
jgi:HEAT repeat protein